ncbi:MAG TPA: hypothetical protein VNT56_01330 [Acidimicrobiales bacterium]|nr:hypothetical protein [Acidimicrobiales bacterium]
MTRSPVYLLSLVTGALLGVLGWLAATVFDASLVASAADISETLQPLPDWAENAPGTIVALGAIAGFLLVHVWLLSARRLRRLVLVYLALVAGIALSAGAGALLLAVQKPATRALFENLADTAPRTLPTSPVVAGVVAALVLARPWIPGRIRTSVYLAFAVWLAHNLAIAEAPPYLGLILDVGAGMVGGSLVALVAKTPNLQPDEQVLVAALHRCGFEIASLGPAAVDARGCVPWLGETPDGRRVFVKALSSDQRAADLLFRAARWLRLRRAGDAPPEVSLRRSVEHEALISHHARSLGVPTPRLLAVAEAGDDQVALVYERLDGRSLDTVAPEDITDEVMAALWAEVAGLRAHAIAHRDLRLANVFLGDDGGVAVLDFSFAELSAGQQLLDTDVAEVLAATSSVIGVERAVRLALQGVGAGVLERARDWLHPLALSSATRQATASAGGLDALREEVGRVTGHTPAEYEPLGRLSPARLAGAGLLAVGVYTLAAVILEDDLAERLGAVDAGSLAIAIGIGASVPMLSAGAFRAASGRRTPFRSCLRGVLAAEVPLTAPGHWSWANRVLSDAARDAGAPALTAKRAAVTWMVAGLLSAPLLTAGLVAASMRVSRGYLQGIGLGVASGIALAGVELLLIRFGPTARELRRVWLRPHRPPSFRGAGLAPATLWWVAVRIGQGSALVFAARSVGVRTSAEALVAIAVSALAVASLLPAPGGVGAVEALTYAGLVIDTDPGVAGVAVVTARVATYWLLLPFALWAYRSTHRYSRAHPHHLEPRPQGAVSTGRSSA